MKIHLKSKWYPNGEICMTIPEAIGYVVLVFIVNLLFGWLFSHLTITVHWK